MPPEVARTEELIRDLHNKMAELQKRNSQKVVKKSLKQKESFKMLRGGEGCGLMKRDTESAV